MIGLFTDEFTMIIEKYKTQWITCSIAEIEHNDQLVITTDANKRAMHWWEYRNPTRAFIGKSSALRDALLNMVFKYSRTKGAPISFPCQVDIMHILSELLY
jgi:hypothetical protein